jgi:3-oxoacyl-[acyl-carrier protein] reductase
MTALVGRRALVCGSTRGIGRACAERLARLGAQVTLLARDGQALEAVRGGMATTADAAGPHRAIAADFSRPGEVEAAVRNHLRDTAAEGPVHILVNNTGGPPSGPLIEADVDALRDAFEAHVVCCQLLARALVPGMVEAGWGRVVNIVSTSVKTPLPNLGVSNTIRAAVANWSKTLAGELAPHGITVNNVLPGATETDRLTGIIEARARREGVDPSVVRERMIAEIPARRFAGAGEIAAAVAFLASDEAGYVSGVNLPVDGGRTACL